MKKKTEIEKGRLGDTFDSFLEERGLLEETANAAIKAVIAWQLSQVMKETKTTNVEMARRMKTSRTQIERVLDPANGAVSIDTLERAAHALGRKLRLELA